MRVLPVTASIFAKIVRRRRTATLRYALAVARRLRTPQVADIIVVNDCNLSCVGCIYYGRLKQGVTGAAFSDRDFRFVIDELILANIPIVSFVGGEPLLNDAVYDAAAYASRRGMVTTTVTNGTLLDDTAVKRIGGLMDIVLVSVDGREEANDGVKGQGSFTRTIGGLTAILADDRPVVIVATTISSINVADIVLMMEELFTLGVKYFKLQPNIIPRHFPTADEVTKLGERLLSFDRSHPSSLIGGKEYIHELMNFYHPAQRLPCFIADMTHISINPDLDVSACCGMFVKVGNIRDDCLREILRTARPPMVDCYGCLSVTLNSNKLLTALR